MKKSALLSLILLCVLSSAKQALSEVDLVKLVKEIQPAVTTVITYDKDKKLLNNGSGFFLDKNGHLITNYHVLKGAYSAEVRTFDGKEYPVKLVVAESEDFDLVKVLVDMPRKDVKFVKVSKSIPSVAERVVVVGSPMGLEHTVSEGIVSAVRDMPVRGKILQISAPISKGSSGSPVVNMKGEVIGVATFQFIEGQNLNFAVTGEEILSLKSGKKGKTLVVWTSDISEKKTEVAKSLFNVGIKFIWTGEYEKALDYFKKAVEENNRFDPAWLVAGFCYDELGRHSEAIEAFKQAIRIRPDIAEAHFVLGLTYNTLGRHSEAIEAFKQAIRIRPDYAEAHCRLGMTYNILAYNQLGRHSEALEAYKQAISIRPDYAEAHLYLGITYNELGRHSEAIEAYKQAIRIRPDYAEAHRFLGDAYEKLDRYQEAIEAYKDAIRIKPDDADAHCNLGIVYFRLNSFQDQEAIEAFKQAIRIKPDHVSGHFNLGLTYILLDDKGSALEEYKILKTLDKNLANILFNFLTLFTNN